jgi:hypothetical protein
MTEPIDIINCKYVGVDKNQEFQNGDIITFVFSDANAEMKDITENNLIGRVDRVEGRYVTLIFSHEIVKNGEVNNISLNRQMVVKMNGYARVSLMGLSGVTPMDLPLADVVNMPPSIIIKNMVERNK